MVKVVEDFRTESGEGNCFAECHQFAIEDPFSSCIRVRHNRIMHAKNGIACVKRHGKSRKRNAAFFLGRGVKIPPILRKPSVSVFFLTMPPLCNQAGESSARSSVRAKDNVPRIVAS